jgi:Glycosyltransferase family 87
MRVLRLVIPALAVGVVIAIQSIYYNRGFIPGDAFTYLAAGERLNDGHLLYALSPGDRPVDLHPPFWTVPLLSPPPIAVLFRPLALLPNDLGPYVWWAASTAAIVGTILVMMRKRPILIGLAVLLLSIPLVYEIGVGNVNALLVAGIVAAWYLLVRGRDVAAGALIATMTVLKLTPVVLAWWLITQRRWGAVRAFLVTGVALGLVSLIGAGISAHFEYLDIVRQTSTTGTSEWSLAGMARFLGVDPAVAAVLPPIALIGGIALIWVLRDRPGLAYSVAVLTMLFGSPVVQVNWFTLLLAAAAPVVWPVDGDPRTAQTAAATSEGRTAAAPSS